MVRRTYLSRCRTLYKYPIYCFTGYLSAPMQSVIPEMGIPVLVQAFVVTVVGGMGSLAGAVVAGLLVGVVTSITVMIAPQLADAAMFGLMAVVLLLRPQGLFGRRGLME